MAPITETQPPALAAARDDAVAATAISFCRCPSWSCRTSSRRGRENPLLEEREEAISAETPTEGEVESDASAAKAADSDVPAAADAAEAPVERNAILSTRSTSTPTSRTTSTVRTTPASTRTRNRSRSRTHSPAAGPPGVPELADSRVGRAGVRARDARYLIGNIDGDVTCACPRRDPRGRLRERKEVEASLALGRSFDPPGVARSTCPTAS